MQSVMKKRNPIDSETNIRSIRPAAGSYSDRILMMNSAAPNRFIDSE